MKIPYQWIGKVIKTVLYQSVPARYRPWLTATNALEMILDG